jgi:hypothetical protein
VLFLAKWKTHQGGIRLESFDCLPEPNLPLGDPDLVKLTEEVGVRLGKESVLVSVVVEVEVKLE